MPHETSRFDTGEPARQLCDRWRATSIEDGWHFPDDWWVPAVDEVAEALCDGRDPAAPCAELGRARAAAAVGLDEALADLNALYVAVTGGTAGTAEPAAPTAGPAVCAAPAHLIRALALGWADVIADPSAGTYCEDPLTGLAVPAYLRVRLGEVYREAERTGLPVPATHGLIVAEVNLRGSGDLTRLSRAVLLGESMRATFIGGETLCSLTPGRAVALGRRDGGLSARAASLRRMLAVELGGFSQRPARVWIEGLPGTLPAAQRLVADLAR
ncbi:MAG: hypothetical protein V7637_6306 [Mycobacteriales bacterium]|jgi:hypothetical protein